MLFPFCYSGGLVEILADQLFRSASQAAASINCIAGTVMVSNIFRGGITDFSCLFIGVSKAVRIRKEAESGKKAEKLARQRSLTIAKNCSVRWLLSAGLFPGRTEQFFAIVKER